MQNIMYKMCVITYRGLIKIQQNRKGKTMGESEKIKKLETLPWQALHDFAVEKGVEAKELTGKDKLSVIRTIIEWVDLLDEEIEKLVNDYIYGDRITFTLWSFQNALKEEDYEKIISLECYEEAKLPIAFFRNLKIISVNQLADRYEILYVYSKEYNYIDENGHNASVWEQHRGCLWIGREVTYLASISKHDKMALYITKNLGRKLDNVVAQIKPPKIAIEKCINVKAISKIVLQSIEGEKTVVSRAGGLTEGQEQEIERIKNKRFDTSGSYIADILDDVSATIRYNVRKGNIGIYKHLPSSILFAWSENAIKIILSEIENMRGKPAEEIFKELGQELKWSRMANVEETQINWYLSQIIGALGGEELEIQIPNEKLPILERQELFTRLSMIYCSICDSYEIPHCVNCGKELQFEGKRIRECECGYPVKVMCSEGHESCEIVNIYLPNQYLKSMISKNIKKIYKEHALEYDFCILGDVLHISGESKENSGVEIPFGSIECFEKCESEVTERLRQYAVCLNEKCDRTCTRPKTRKCIVDKGMVCLPKVFYSILPSYMPQPHKGGEYGDVAGEVKVGMESYELKGIIKKNSKNSSSTNNTYETKVDTRLLSTSKEGQEIIRQFVEQGLTDARCGIIAVIVPQYIDGNLKGTLRYLARIGKKKVTFIELDEVCKLISKNPWVLVPEE